jgi:hypothetical protein
MSLDFLIYSITLDFWKKGFNAIYTRDLIFTSAVMLSLSRNYNQEIPFVRRRFCGTTTVCAMTIAGTWARVFAAGPDLCAEVKH